MTKIVHIVDPAEIDIDAARAIALSGELASYARAAQDPLAMVEAAKLLAALPHSVFTPGATTAAALYAEARLLARSDPAMLAEIDAVQYGFARPARGSCYAAESWVVGYRGNGVGLSATPAPQVRFRVGAPVWTGPRPASAA
ncbi:hypothetical protein [Sphingomonas sp. CCH9-E2]|uniref:hypothetical protein n=1 Tax=Sphingomonas sp. CCH9-E2 TaxID=1768776 RepID=UPI00082FAEDC|nr:hypothetical protein [Sphingomonas sp. CCH9-E2]